VLRINLRDIAEGRNIESTGVKTEQFDSDYVTRIIEVLKYDHVLLFKDGSVYSPGSAGSVGCGACAAVLFPRSQENVKPQIEAHAVGTSVSTEQCEIDGILLGMEIAIQYIKETNIKGDTYSIFIFCDCQRANDIFGRHYWLSRHPEILERVLGICDCEQLEDISCVIKLVEMFGHAGITGNC